VRPALLPVALAVFLPPRPSSWLAGSLAGWLAGRLSGEGPGRGSVRREGTEAAAAAAAAGCSFAQQQQQLRPSLTAQQRQQPPWLLRVEARGAHGAASPLAAHPLMNSYRWLDGVCLPWLVGARAILPPFCRNGWWRPRRLKKIVCAGYLWQRRTPTGPQPAVVSGDSFQSPKKAVSENPARTDRAVSRADGCAALPKLRGVGTDPPPALGPLPALLGLTARPKQL